MKLETRNMEHLELLHKTIKKNHSVSAETDQGFQVRISISKDAPEFLDSWMAADEMFDVRSGSSQMMLSEFEHVTVSDKIISLTN